MGVPVKNRGTAWSFGGEREPALRAATNHYCHTVGTSVEIFTQPNTYRDRISVRGGKGWLLNWQSRQPKQ